MSELLIKLEGASKPLDPNAWGRGHVVAVMPDGCKWGNLECPPKFLVVRAPDMSIKEAGRYLEKRIDRSNPLRPKIIAIRDRQINISAMSAKYDTTKRVLQVAKSEVVSFTEMTAVSIG